MKEIDSKIIKYLYIFSLCFIFFIALYLRLRVFLEARPFWHDEAYVALTVIKNNFFSIFSETRYNMKAPFLFWAAVKSSGVLFGYKELALRLYPMICSLISVFIFYFFSKAFLQNKFIIVIANLLFAINYRLLYYAQELKQYSSDVLFFMIALLFFSKLAQGKFDKKHALYFVLSGIFTVLASFPACFAAAAFIIYKLTILKKDEIKYFFAGLFIISAAAAAYYFCYIDRLYERELRYFYDYWHYGFITADNIFDVLKRIYYYNFNHCKNYFLGLSLCSTGLILTIFEKKTINKILLISLIIVLTASFLKIYPLFERIQIYLIPVFIVFILKIADIHFKRFIYFIIAVLIILLNFAPVFNKCYIKEITYKQIFERWNCREIVKIVKDNYSKDDVILMNRFASAEFDYYSIYHNFSHENILFYDFQTKTYDEFKKFADSLEPDKHYWFININTSIDNNIDIYYFINWKASSKNIITEHEYVWPGKTSYIAKIKYVL